MPDGESILVVPLRSNASTTLTGAPIAAMRRRLKFASLIYDHLYLESGVLRLQAGPGGSFNVVEHRPGLRWQTPAGRHKAEQSPLHLAVGREPTPGVTPAVMQTALYTDTTHSWVATLDPFEKELPPGCDWVEFVRSADPTGDAERLMRQWNRADEHNPALEQAIPGQFIRGAVIGNANRDLVLAAVSGCAVTSDPLHQQVVAQRFKDDAGWHLRGYSVPFLFPHAGELPWESIADLRRERHMARYRGVLQEVEQEAAAEAGGGDLETAAHHAYERHLAAASGSLESVGGAIKHIFRRDRHRRRGRCGGAAVCRAAGHRRQHGGWNGTDGDPGSPSDAPATPGPGMADCPPPP
jgi:hypothetical protein